MKFHILRNFFSIFGFQNFWTSIQYPLSIIDLFNQYPNQLRCKKFVKIEGSGDFGGYEECEDFSYSSHSY